MSDETYLNIDEKLINQAEKEYEEQLIPIFYDEDGFEYYPGWKTLCLKCFLLFENIYDMSIPYCPKCEEKEQQKKLVGKQYSLFKID
jgi:hypothetical protein